MADYPNARDCEHGNLRRACATCEWQQERDTLQARVAALESALREYGEHRSGCAFLNPPIVTCTCGLFAALARPEAQSGEVEP